MGRIIDWLTGRSKPVSEETKEPETLRSDDRAKTRLPPEEIRRVKGETRPGERLLPSETARMHDMHDHPRDSTPAPLPQQKEVATKLAYTRTAQPNPSIGGPGKIFVPGTTKKSIWEGDIADARKDKTDYLTIKNGYEITDDRGPSGRPGGRER